jgi:pimeloyl-ACP methyl ester carboxylesterase
MAQARRCVPSRYCRNDRHVRLKASTPLVPNDMRLATESYHISADPGIHLHIRNTRPDTLTAFTSERTVLFVHGATYPSDTMFGLKIDGESWMEYIARHGYDVYSLDVRGYGRSTRPPEMDRPALDNPPVVTTDEAVRDFAVAVDHIRQRRGVLRLNLIGWSWGTVIAGAFAAAHPDKTERLVMYAPLWLRRIPGGLSVDGQMGAYRLVTFEAAKQRWLSGVPAGAANVGAHGRRADLIAPGVLEAWWAANMAADPIGAKMSPPAVRAPNGLLVDALAYWEADRRYYDPSAIRAAVLMVVGDWDVDTPAYMAEAILARLTQSPRTRLVIIGEGTHHLMLERNRTQLFREVQLFLDEAL